MGKAPCKFFNVTETSEYLGLSYANTYKRILAGEIPAKRIGRRWLVNIDELNVWASNPKKQTRKAVLAANQSNLTGFNQPQKNLVVSTNFQKDLVVSTNF